MNTRLFVGNLSYDVTETELRDLFTAHGQVDDVAVIMDRETGESRGFAFVTMGDRDGVEAAIRELDGSDLNGREMKVNEARPREERPSFSGGGGGGGFRGGGGGARKGGGGSRKGGGGSRKGGGGGGDRW